MVEQLISAARQLEILYWFCTERKLVKRDKKEEVPSIHSKLIDARDYLLGYEESGIKETVNEMNDWIKSLEESYEVDDEIDDDQGNQLDSASRVWRRRVTDAYTIKLKSLKDTTDIFNELRSTRDILTKMGEKSEIEEIKFLLTDINKSSISLLFSSPTRRTFEPKLRGILTSTNSGPVYMAGYFDQAMLPELSDMTDKVELRILSPELKNTRQDNVNKDALERLHKKGAKIKVHSMLHARFVVTPTESIVGSADIKSDCLGGRRYDLCVYTNNPILISDLRDYANSIWSEAKYLF